MKSKSYKEFKESFAIALQEAVSWTDHEDHADTHEDLGYHHTRLRDKHDANGNKSMAAKHDLAADHHIRAEGRNRYAHQLIHHRGPNDPMTKKAIKVAKKATAAAYHHSREAAQE